MTSTIARQESIVESASELEDLVRSEAAEAERLRTTTAPVIDKLFDSGLLISMNPAAAGGVEPTFDQILDTWIEMARQDGSYGWTCIANMCSAFAAATYLPDAGFAEVFTALDNRVTVAGQFFPNGQGTVVDGGYRVSGTYHFGTGTGHSAYIAAGFTPQLDGEVQFAENGLPVMKVALVPRDEVNFTDGWFSQGLKGTGSYDYAVEDVFVPEHRTIGMFEIVPRRGEYACARMGLMPITAAAHAAWAIGVSKSMLDDVQELAATKYRMSDMESLASRPTFQKGLAHHVSSWRAARLLMHDVLNTAEAAVTAGDELTLTMRADIRAATVYATDVAREACQWAHLVAGTSAIRENSRLDRAFRDMYTGTQHAFVAEKVAIDAAQVWLGIIDSHPAM